MTQKIFFVLLCFTQVFCHAQEIPKEPTDISPLLIGEKIPDIQLKDINGSPVTLANLAGEKQTVLIFYRGGWCPYCNVHLGEIQTIEQDILNAGYQIVAISPDAPENLKASIDKHKLNYKLLSDRETKAAQGFGLAYQAPERYHNTLSKSSGGGNKGVLPVPALFVLNRQGEILFEYINPDYKKRIKGSLLLSVIKGLE